ncbi:DUF6236 family protein [Janthinobacterium sp. BJB426]|uniref:DUF6236 family protein n=1 Tax=Janthinobacterium sp. BJB426 TaxID=2048010 RepID=UPI0013053E09|nr:DUF6236 family protein [Janthinobacterium sp. BJB426]
MGEAKSRKLHEENFGKVPKVKAYRGLVISPPLEIEGSRLLVKSAALDPQELRFALLFWDKLVWPSSRAIHIGSGPNELFLESAGILSRPDYTFNGDGAQGVALGYFAAFQDREKAEPGVWAMSQGERSLNLIGQYQEKEKGALLELHRAIPLPSIDVPLQEILEFKEKRKDELWLLRNRLDSLLSDLDVADDRELAFAKQIKEIDEACANLIAVGRDWKFPVLLSNLKASFNLTPSKFLPAIAGGWAMGKEYGLTAAATAAGVAGLVSTLEIKGDFGLRGVLKPNSPYQYAFHIDRELG